MVVGVGFGLLMKFNLGILGLFLVVDGLILLSLLRIKVEDEIKDELIPYFEALLGRLEKVGCGVRNMAIQIECEYGKSRLLTLGKE